MFRSNQLEQQSENERMVEQLTRRQAELAQAYNNIQLLEQHSVKAAEQIEVRNYLPRTRTELGRRSFPVAALTVWNSLPAHLRSTLISRADSLEMG